MINNYQPTIGLEIHAELKTATKMFCGCENISNLKSQMSNVEPNNFVCPVCLGLPGALPVPNQKALEMTLMIARALNCEIASLSKWDRKNYFYPDLPKGFQISQYDLPLASGGWLNVKVEITRVHLEEDTGKLIHPSGEDYSLIDFNRAGLPLVELVTEPVIKSASQAKAFAQEYQLLLRYLGVSDADMEKGQMRVEANISINQKSKTRLAARQVKNQKLGTKVEVKNLNSFRAVERAIDYEINRQTNLLEKGEKVIQETRGWDEGKQQTFSQRTKETSSDYRYFPEPDIPPIKIFNFQFSIFNLPELPNQKRQRFAKFGIKPDDIEVLVGDLARMKKFEQAVESHKDLNLIQSLANLLVHKPETVKLSVVELVNLAKLSPHQQKAKLAGQEVLAISQLEISKIVKNVVETNPKIVLDIRLGKSQAIGALIGQVMAKTKGAADPRQIKKLIEDML